MSIAAHHFKMSHHLIIYFLSRKVFEIGLTDQYFLKDMLPRACYVITIMNTVIIVKRLIYNIWKKMLIIESAKPAAPPGFRFGEGEHFRG